MSQGSVGDALKKDHQLATEYDQDQKAIELDKNEDSQPVKQDESSTAITQPNRGKLVVAEEKEEGNVSRKSCESMFS